MLLDDVRIRMQAALKAHDAVTVETLRFLLAAVRNAAIAKYGAEGETRVTDTDVLDIVKKQVKTHNESVDAFTKAGRTELARREKEQLAILESYLPAQLTDDELRILLEPIAAEGGEFGPMMGRAMKAAAGKADGTRVSSVLRQLTASK